MSPEESTDKTAQMRSLFEGRSDVRLAYLFGSRAEGTAAEGTDYDIGVLPAEDADNGLRFELIHDLGELLDTGKVDVVMLDRAPCELAYCVVARGEEIYEPDEVLRVDFGARVMSKCFDYLPVMERQRRDIIEEAIS